MYGTSPVIDWLGSSCIRDEIWLSAHLTPLCMYHGVPLTPDWSTLFWRKYTSSLSLHRRTSVTNWKVRVTEVVPNFLNTDLNLETHPSSSPSCRFSRSQSDSFCGTDTQTQYLINCGPPVVADSRGSRVTNKLRAYGWYSFHNSYGGTHWLWVGETVLVGE